jgi:DNA helicase HerA-like ATPase
MQWTEPNFNQLRDLTIGTVEFVSPKEIRIALNDDSPKNTALNTGTPILFPKLNGFVLIPNETGAVVGIISWIGVEQARGIYKSEVQSGLVDLPYPSRRMSVNPLGILKLEHDRYRVERGVYNYPSVGDSVVLPTQEQLKAIVENEDKTATINIGTSPLAANAPVFVNPDKLFGRHVAVLGNTGSGKSCSVAGLIRWSIESAKKSCSDGKNPNIRFIVLDPNGEYTNTFDDIASNVRKFKVMPEDGDGFKQLRVPVWLWNSYEWSAVSQATGKTQRPLLRRALRELRAAEVITNASIEIDAKRFLTSFLVAIKNLKGKGIGEYAQFPGKQNTGEFLKAAKDSLEIFRSLKNISQKEKIEDLLNGLNDVLERRAPNKSGFYPPFELGDLEEILHLIDECLLQFNEIELIEGPSEDSPVRFNGEDLINHIERLAQEQNIQQYLDFMVMRIRTMLADSRMSSVVSTDEDIDLVQWLEEYIGKDQASNGEVAVIDLSIVPQEILHIVVAVISRMIFEALQRYRRLNRNILPTVIVMEEAHNFIGRYYDDGSFSPARLCTESFEKIAKEGRKFGLGLMLSSQRPSELSSTVLSQCNTFLLHRIVNDKDQELVKKLVPDSLGGLLNELPILPTRKAILLGWAAPIPILVEMRELAKEHQPHSHDPDFWKVWIGEEERTIDWQKIANDWQMRGANDDNL